MQRKVFYRAGVPILATRGDGFFETVGTLQQLIEEGRQQQRDLSQWLEAAEPVAATLPEALLETAPEAVEAAPVEPAAAESGASPPKRPRQKRGRPELVPPELVTPEPVAQELAAEDAAEAEPPKDVEADAEVAELVIAPLPPAPSRSLGRTAARA